MRCNCGNFKPRITTNGVNDIIVCANCGRAEPELETVKADVKPVYTQDMFDNSELPPIGSEFSHKGNTVTTISISKEYEGVITFTPDDGCSIECCWFNGAWCQPLDTRTDTEKSEESMIENLTNEGIITYDPIMLKILIAKIKAGKIHGVTWSDNND